MKFVLASFLFIITSTSVLAQKISYTFSAPNATHHEAEITVTAEKLPLAPAIFRMSRSSPGRYATHEFGKNVYNVKAFDAAGKPLTIERKEGDVYSVAGHKGVVKVSYTLFANYADGTYADVDATGYHLNIPATFMWVKGMEKAPISISFAVPNKDWKIATQLKQEGTTTFSAPDLQYFMDSPVKIGELHIREWKVTTPGAKTLTVRLALQAEATDSMVDTFTNNLKKIVAQASEVFGEYPSFDYGTYTFLASINPYVKGDGMEHRNSTMITIPTVFNASNDLLGVFSHEFFHCWNVERIRPKSLQPFNFEKSNMSEALWLAEGFTQYYGNLLQVRSKVITEQEFWDGLGRLINAKTNVPGGANYSPIHNSQHAVFVDASVSIDKNNYANMFSSYYTYGGAVALALDLELRNKFAKSLDTYMQQLWKQFGKQEVPYTLPGLQQALASITTTSFAANFFRQYVYGHKPYDYTTPLRAAKLNVEKVNSQTPWIGNNAMRPVEKGLMLAGNTVRNTPLYIAGVDVDDILVEVDGQKLKELKDLDVIKKHKINETLPLTYMHRGDTVKTTIQLLENNWLKVVDASSTQPASDKSITFREAWIGDKTKGR
ncbi:MAG: peptidase [Segetibacter sp.]|nr:peptidase [Segetibacter sp.]